MTEVATLKSNHSLELPVAIAEHFQPSDPFVLWKDNDTLHLKQITPAPLCLVEQSPPGNRFR